MRETDHQIAQRQIEAALNGKLSPAGQRELDAHLAACAECRQAAEQMRAVETRLRSAMHARWDGTQANSERARHIIEKKTRAIEMSKKVLNLAGAGLAIAALVLVIVFSISLLPGRKQPGGGPSITPEMLSSTPTSYPYPIGEGLPPNVAAEPYPLPQAYPYPEPYPGIQEPEPTQNPDVPGATVKEPTWLPEGYVYDKTYTSSDGIACLSYYHRVYQFGTKLSLLEAVIGAFSLEDLQPPDQMQGVSLTNEPVSVGGANDGLFVYPAVEPATACGKEYSIWGKALMFQYGGVQYVVFGHDAAERAGYVSKLDLLRVAESITGVSTIPAYQVDAQHLRSPEEALGLAKFAARIPAWVPAAPFSHGYLDPSGMSLILVYEDIAITQASYGAPFYQGIADIKSTYPADAYEEIRVWGQPALYVQGAWTQSSPDGPTTWDKSFSEEILAWEKDGISYRIQASRDIAQARQDLPKIAESMTEVVTQVAEPTVAVTNTATVTYTVQAGDTLAKIAYDYNITVESLLWANISDVSSISSPATVNTGQVLQVPVECASTSQRVGAGIFAWPLASHDLSGANYDPASGHGGIDLGGQVGDPVYAADAGVVIYAGWNSNGYGNLVVIDHGNGFQTVYAHLSQITIACGIAIGQGEMVGKVGATGNTSGPLLHFEVIKDGQRVNPIDYLP